MKFFVIASATLASFAAATPDASEQAKCKPATYRCEPDNRGWDVCDVSGEWVFAGRCPPKTVCRFNRQNNSPYCLPRNFVAVEVEQAEM